jgi:hypothetical protein
LTADHRGQLQQIQQTQNRQDLYPWLSAGKAALSEQRKQLGLGQMDPNEAGASDITGASGGSSYKPVPGGGSRDYYDPAGRLWKQETFDSVRPKTRPLDFKALRASALEAKIEREHTPLNKEA